MCTCKYMSCTKTSTELPYQEWEQSLWNSWSDNCNDKIINRRSESGMGCDS